MKKYTSQSVSYKEQDQEIIKMFENYNRVLISIGLFLAFQFSLLLAIL